jgi:hypothetical protein
MPLLSQGHKHASVIQGSHREVWHLSVNCVCAAAAAVCRSVGSRRQMVRTRLHQLNKNSLNNCLFTVLHLLSAAYMRGGCLSSLLLVRVKMSGSYFSESTAALVYVLYGCRHYAPMAHYLARLGVMACVVQVGPTAAAAAATVLCLFPPLCCSCLHV